MSWKTMTRWVSILAAVAACLAAAWARAEQRPAPHLEATFYVATDGSDSWSGRLPAPNADRSDGPFATLEKARDAIRRMERTGAKRRW